MIVFDDIMHVRRFVNDRLRVDEAQVQLHPVVARRSRIGFDPRPEQQGDDDDQPPAMGNGPEVKARSPRTAKEERQRSIKQFGARLNIAVLERVGSVPRRQSFTKRNAQSLPPIRYSPSR